MTQELGLPYIEPAFGKHALPLDRERSRSDAIQYVTRGRSWPTGWGRHRRNVCAHFRYQVTEAAA